MTSVGNNKVVSISPKAIKRTHLGIPYSIEYDPETKKWTWLVEKPVTTTLKGTSASCDEAEEVARQLIKSWRKASDHAKSRKRSRQSNRTSNSEGDEA